jgi:hypothetical protein
MLSFICLLLNASPRNNSGWTFFGGALLSAAVPSVSLCQHSRDVFLGRFVYDILGSGIDQFAWHLKFCEFLLQQDSEVR